MRFEIVIFLCFGIVCFFILGSSVLAQSKSTFYASCWDGSTHNEEYGKITRKVGYELASSMVLEVTDECRPHFPLPGFGKDEDTTGKIVLGLEYSLYNAVYYPQGEEAFAEKIASELSDYDPAIVGTRCLGSAPPSAREAQNFLCNNYGRRAYLQLNFDPQNPEELAHKIKNALEQEGVEKCVTITEFDDGSDSKEITFGAGGGQDDSIGVDVPLGYEVMEARVKVSGNLQSQEPSPADVVLVTDVSQSMSEFVGFGPHITKLEKAKEAGRNFVDVFLSPENTGIGSRLGLVSYSGRLESYKDLTEDKASLLGEINSYMWNWGTCISCGLQKALDLLEGPSSRNDKKFILLMSDGYPNTNIDGSTCLQNYCPEAAEEAKAVARRIGQRGIKIYTVSFGDAHYSFMDELAEIGSGEHFYADATDIVEVYNRIAEIIMESTLVQNPAVDVGGDGSIDVDLIEWKYTGRFSQEDTIEFGESLNNLVKDCTCPSCALINEICKIRFSVSSESAGVLRLQDLYIKACNYRNLPPVADFTWTPHVPTAGKNVGFDASSSYDPDGTIVKYEWDFGDGTLAMTESDPKTQYQYADAGIYVVVLTVTDNDGLTDTIMKSLSVNEPHEIPGERICEPVKPITEFDDDSASKEITFGAGGGQDASIGIVIPFDSDYEVLGARVKASGERVRDMEPKPVDVVLVTDVSSSMTTEVEPGVSMMDKAKEAALSFVENVLDAGGIALGTKVGLVSYAGSVISRVDLTNDLDELEGEINSYIAEGSTCISCGLSEARDIILAGANANKFIVLMTDGKEHPRNVPSLLALAEEIKNQGITIYTVSFGEEADQELMEEVAQAGGGKHFHADETDIVEIYREIAKKLVAQSYPVNPSVDLGDDGAVEWQYSGEFSGTEQIDFTESLKELLVACNCPSCGIRGDECVLGFKVISESLGKLILNELFIEACIWEEVEPENQPPVADFSWFPNSPPIYAGIVIDFDASSSFDPDGTIVLYGWDFGDGTIIMEQDPETSHTYTDPGTYTVTLVVRDNGGLTNLASATIEITTPETNEPPVADFEWGPYAPNTADSITFDASSSYDPDGTIVKYEWDFGDRTTASETDPITEHTYTAAGIYVVKLTVTDDGGLTGEYVETVNVNNCITITEFDDGSVEKEIKFYKGGGTDVSVGVNVPLDYRIVEAKVTIEGGPSLIRDSEPVLDAILLTDVTGSMVKRVGSEGVSMMDLAKKFGLDLADIILSPEGIQAGNRMGIVSYGESPAQLAYVPLTHNENLIDEKISRYYTSRWTCLSCGLEKAIELALEGTNIKKSIIILTDGWVNVCKDKVTCTGEEAREEVKLLAREARMAGITLNVISFSEDANREFMDEIAYIGGGVHLHADEMDLPEIYRQILKTVQLKYPENPSADLGADGVKEWEYLGQFYDEEEFDFRENLEELIKDCNCYLCTIIGGKCNIKFALSSESMGVLRLRDLYIEACSIGEATGTDIAHITGSTGIIKIAAARGQRKAISKYTEKEVFLISNTDWKKVLGLVPVTVWTDPTGITHKHPTLIFHQEDESFDADSIIYFLQQYTPNRVTIVGDTPPELDNLLVADPEMGAGLNPDQIQRINHEDYLSYWDSFTEVVYVKDDYELALLASTYASLINAPLIIKWTSMDSPNVFANKNVICVGDVSPEDTSCSERYNLAELQKKYLSMTNTDKLLLVNPADLDIMINESFYAERSGSPIYRLYTGDSLAAPFLASAKHELVISISLELRRADDTYKVDAFIDTKIAEIEIAPEYLTIIASPAAIEMTSTGYVVPQIPESTSFGDISADAWYYSQIDDEPFLDLAVGRIFGITVSDTSSNIARSLFYNELLKNPDKILVTEGCPDMVVISQVYGVGYFLSYMTDYQTTVRPAGRPLKICPFPDTALPEHFMTPEDWRDKFLIFYDDHGTYDWAGIYSHEIPNLDNAFVIAQACGTCMVNEPYGDPLTFDSSLFCANVIRRGGIGYIGAVNVNKGIVLENFLSEIFSQGRTVGKAFLNGKNGYMAAYGRYIDSYPRYTLLGDPTFKLKLNYQVPKPQLKLVREDQGKKYYKLIVPAMKVETPEDIIKLGLGGTEFNFLPNINWYFTTAYTDVLPFTLNWGLLADPSKAFKICAFSSRFDTSDDFEHVDIAQPGWGVGVEDTPKGKKLWIASPRRDFKDNYFETANDQGFTNFEFDITLVE